MFVKLIGILVVVLALSGCTGAPAKTSIDTNNVSWEVSVGETIAKGNYVTLYYKGTLDDGTVFDETAPESPATFQVGVGGLIEGFDNGLLGMKVGEKKTILIPAEKAYGEIDPTRLQIIDGNVLTDANIPLTIGITVSSSVGNAILAAYDETTGKVTLDYNHPLAGEQLTFEVEIIKISNTP
jgi:peptidylprolyl isomerase